MYAGTMNEIHDNIRTIHGFRYLSYMVLIFDMKSGNFGHEIMMQDLKS